MEAAIFSIVPFTIRISRFFKWCFDEGSTTVAFLNNIFISSVYRMLKYKISVLGFHYFINFNMIISHNKKNNAKIANHFQKLFIILASETESKSASIEL